MEINSIDPDAATAFRRPVLNSFAEEKGNPFEFESFAYAAELNGETVATIDGYTLYEWAYVSYLAVGPEHRGKGVGSKLMDHVEQRAHDAGLTGVQLDTFRYQAPAFYAARGYEERMILHGREPERDRIFFEKRFGM